MPGASFLRVRIMKKRGRGCSKRDLKLNAGDGVRWRGGVGM